SGVALRFVVTPQRFVGGVQLEGKTPDPPSRGELHSFTQLNLGAPFDDADIATSVNSLTHLFQTNGLYRSQVQPNVAQAGDAGEVLITFRVNAGKRSRYEHPVIQGQTLLSDSVILRVTGWRFPIIHRWRLATNARTRGGVQRLLARYQKQERLTARVELGEVEYDEATKGVRPHLTVTPGPKVEVRTLEAKVSKRILKRYLPVYQERSVDPQLLLEGKRNLEDYFQSQGYPDVSVEFRVAPPVKDVEVISYVISRGQRHKVVLVRITGNKYFTEDTIRERMFIQARTFNLRHGRYSDAFRRKDEANITELYQSNGFRDVKVAIGADTNYQGNSGDVAVTAAIEEGPQWLVDHVTLAGFSQLQPAAITGSLSSAAGQPFSEVSLASDRNAILTEYFKQGFAGAVVTARWDPAETPNRVNVTYTVNEGNRQYVRDVITSGTHRTRPDLIARHLTLKPGDPLSPVAQTAIQKSLYDLGIFARVETAIENPGGNETHKYVLYNFDEGDRYRLNVGVGAVVARFGTPSNTSLSSPGGTTGFSPEISLGVSLHNFQGRGDTVSFRSLYSSIEKRGSISYLHPRFRDVDGRSLSYTLLYDNTLDVRTFAAIRQEASVQLSQTLSKSLTGLLGFAYRRVSVSRVIIPVLLVPQFVQPVRIGILTGSLVQDRRDNRSNPSRGIYNTADIGLADRWFGSQRSFGRLLVRNATYYRLTRTLILARQTQFGIIAPFSIPKGLTAAGSIPLPERFFGGGADSLRSFPFNQAGPRDTGAALIAGGPSSKATGFPLGGNALLFNNVELRFPLLGENIQGVLFHDMGNIYSSIRNLSFRVTQRDLQDFNYMVHAAGFGIRYRTPVGPIRVDLAYSINPPAYNGFGGTPLQLLQCNPNADPSTAPGFCQSTRQRISHFQFFFSIGQTF
ncbi:MAG TPA: BamA/TamA family outer membrane protein, partial [Bryobacteraceae bacterium]|nr:BamA/TamA family outer membrane protein [Bryobacteraceae bacterium]